MPNYEDRLFGPSWLDCGKVKDFVIENKTPLSLLRTTFTTFQESEEYKFIIKAMKDWNVWVDAQWSGLEPETLGYNIRMGQLQAMRRYMSWFQKMIVDLKGLEDLPADGEENRKESIKDYV